MMTKQKNSGLVCFGAGLGFGATSLLERGHHLRSRVILLRIIVGLTPLCALTAGEAEELTATGTLPFTDPYVYVERFTNSPDVKALGFPVGPKPFLNLGMVVEKEEAEKAGTQIDIVSARATNGKVTFDLVYADIGILDLWDNYTEEGLPVFDPANHKGTWTITATDSNGASANTGPVLLEQGFEMPFVENLRTEEMASGDLRVIWSVPELDAEIEEKCDIDYRVRLLYKDTEQLYRSDPTTETFVTVPADTVKEKVGDSLDGVWGRVEMECRDKEQKDENGLGEVVAKSNTLVPLK
jgi:hypothetical protein